MGCGCKSDLFVLASNTRLESERNGAPAIYWDDPSNAMKLLGATSVQVWLNLIESFGSEGSAYEVALVAQQSTDGVDWDIDSTQNLSTWTSRGKATERIFVESRAEFGPYVRFGIQVRNTQSHSAYNDFEGMYQVAVRLSMAILPYGGDNEVGHGGDLSSPHAMTSIGAVAGTVIEVTQYKSLVVGVEYNGVDGTPVLVIQTGPSSDGPWYETDGTLSGPNSGLLATEKLLAYARLYVETASDTSGTLDSWSHVERSF